jgi:hypothetical protein
MDMKKKTAQKASSEHSGQGHATEDNENGPEHQGVEAPKELIDDMVGLEARVAAIEQWIGSVAGRPGQKL